MATVNNKKASAVPAGVETPWYDLIDDPVPPEDAMQQDDTLHYVMSGIRARYEDDPTVLVSDETNLIYDSARAGSVVAPDGYVVFGVDARMIKRERRSYRIQEWGETPAFVLEAASESTAPNDLGRKRQIYASMGAQEYWRLDRTGLYYGEPLVGERLVNGEYERFELHTADNGDVWSRSEVLGFDFYYHKDEDGYGEFLLRDSTTGEWINTLGCEAAARRAEAAARQAEADVQRAESARADRAEAEVLRLRQRLQKLGHSDESQD